MQHTNKHQQTHVGHVAQGRRNDRKAALQETYERSYGRYLHITVRRPSDERENENVVHCTQPVYMLN